MLSKRISTPVAIGIILIVSIVVGGITVYWCFNKDPEINFRTPEIKFEEDTTADWKTYEWNKLEFKYPSTWTVEEIYYSTPAQQAQEQSPENIGLNVFPGEEIKGKDFIAIGGRQVSCELSQNHTKCNYVDSIANFIYTDSNSTEVLNVFDQVLSTFKFIEEKRGGSFSVTEKFSYPFPISWGEVYDGVYVLNFFLSGVSVGRRNIPFFISSHDSGEEIYALTLYFNIKTYKQEGRTICPEVRPRLVIDEEGNSLLPLNQEYNNSCFLGDKTYYGQEVIFEVPESQKEFFIKTGGKFAGGDSDIFIEINILENNELKVEMSPTSEKGLTEFWGFGISPPWINRTLSSGSHLEETIYLVINNSVEELVAELRIEAPGFEDWIKVDKGLNIPLPKNLQGFPIKLIVDVPPSVEEKNYEGSIFFRIKSDFGYKIGQLEFNINFLVQN